MSEALDLAKALNRSECLDILSDVVSHKSYSETEGERKLAEHVASIMEKMGLEVELMPVVGNRVNAIGRWRGTGGGKSLLFNGHLDTNPVTEGWTVDPWGGLVDDEFIYGIGVSNMKAGDMASLCAVKTLIDSGKRLKGDVILTYVIGELQGGIGTLAAVNSGLRADYFINSEPSDLQAITMHAAAFTFTIELEGITRHLSKREAGVDAIMAACALIPELNEMTFSDAPSEEHRSVNRVHVGVVHGALGKELHEWRPPQVADYVRIKGSGRYGPGQTRENAVNDLRKKLDELEARFPGLKATVTPETRKGQPTMPAFEVAKDARIVTALNAAYKAVRGKDQPTGAIAPPAYFGTDAGHLWAVGGMEGVVCGPGGKYNTMPDERVEIDEYLDMIRVYLMTMADICEME